MQRETLELQARLNQLYKESDELYHRLALQFGLSDAAASVIYSLCESDQPYSQKELCAQWSLTKTTINSAVNGLVKEGFVSLTPSPDNYKVKLVSLTDSGKELGNRFVRPLINAEQNAFNRLSEGEREALLTLSKKHLEILREEISGLLKE
ncbi:MAG: MarR family winged helix-turn-helix transcriptional regulator [Suipraeoptans sp.]